MQKGSPEGEPFLYTIKHPINPVFISTGSKVSSPKHILQWHRMILWAIETSLQKFSRINKLWKSMWIVSCHESPGNFSV
jgi:hypothetical protein